MWLPLQSHSGIPIYRQLFQQIRSRILSGQLPAESQLPSVRDLSAQLHINPLTVAKVYQLLEQEGLAETRRGRGTFVSASAEPISKAERRRKIEPILEQLAAEALHLGLSLADVHALVDAAFSKKQPPEHLP
jgi:GntR family transcriptional regulator